MPLCTHTRDFGGLTSIKSVKPNTLYIGRLKLSWCLIWHFILFVYELSIILDLHFPSICYRKLLSPPVVPANHSARVGVVRNFNLDDLAQFMPVCMHTFT